MARSLEGRLLRMEHHHRGALAEGCRECRHWTHALVVFTDREDPPPFCPKCGRARPETRAIFEYDLPYEFDAEEVIHDAAR